MGIFCALAGHRAATDTVCNDGTNFSNCTRCGADLVEIDGAWGEAPKGFRIRRAGAAGATARSVADAAPPPAAADPSGEQRTFSDRRANPGALPAFLGGRERRRLRDRRKGFGRKVTR